MDTRRGLTVVLLVLFAVLAAAAVVLGARAEDDQKEELGAVIESAPEATIPPSAPEEQTLVLRLMAPADGCWTRTMEGEVIEGCGSLTLSVQVEDEVDISFERNPPASWTWCLVGFVDGRVVLTRGPDSTPEYSLDVYWAPVAVLPPAVSPVTCAGSSG